MRLFLLARQNWDRLKNTNETILVVLVVLIVALTAFGFYGLETEKTYGFVCPSDFTDREEYMNSVARWISEYQKDYPDATADDMMKVRDQLAAKYNCGSAPIEATDLPSEEELNSARLMDGIKYAESQREDPAADDLIIATSEKEMYDNSYIKHLRISFAGYLDGTNTGIEEGTTDKSELESGIKCGLDSFDKAYFRSQFEVIKVEKNDYGGIAAYIAFIDKPDIVFWAWVYRLASDDGEGEYTLRGFCEYAALKPTENEIP